MRILSKGILYLSSSLVNPTTSLKTYCFTFRVFLNNKESLAWPPLFHENKLQRENITFY